MSRKSPVSHSNSVFYEQLPEGENLEEAERYMIKAIALHLYSLAAQGEPIAPLEAPTSPAAGTPMTVVQPIANGVLVNSAPLLAKLVVVTGKDTSKQSAQLPSPLEEAVKLSPQPRNPGAMAGDISIAPDFKQLPNDIAQAFGVIPE